MEHSHVTAMCAHCGSMSAPQRWAVPWKLRFAVRPVGAAWHCVIENPVWRCVSENQCERREMRKRGRERREMRKRGRATLRERLPVGTRVCINDSDLDEYIGETGTVIGHDEPSNDPALVIVRFDTAVGSLERDAFYEAELSPMETRSYEGYMGTRSDVVVMLKRDLDALVPEEKRQAWFDGANRHEHAEGFAYVWRDVKWYIDSDENISQLYAWLEDVDVEYFEIIVAYHEYPENDEDDRGAWYANPWNARKDATVSLVLDLKTAPIAAEETPTIGSSAMISRPLLLLEIPATAAEEGNLEDGWQDGELHEVYTAREIAAMLKVVIAERDEARAKLVQLEQRTKELR